jgi:eukaryotic-like serine/threonine-protein kinase
MKRADDPEGGEQEELLFLEALRLANHAERDAFLDRACAGNQVLRARLQVLLQAHESADSFLGSPEGPTAEAAMPLAPEESPGTVIGRYKLLQQIGEGGFGVVYVAEQEEPVRRRVALKVIKLGMDTKAVIARFEAERQALALMDHPNIAKVFDAGATETGRPFFVMELVRGIKITEYCDQNNVPVSERLDLFVQVCHAIQHAHQKGIIHRDIKPSNILVMMADDKPVPKVIDFGIAKATAHQPLTDKTLYTAFEQFIGTPAYMSPEQAGMSGLDIDTRSDIYSLGVLLYELLTGSTPFDTKELLESGLDHMRQIIREREPVRPSTRLTQIESSTQSQIANRKSRIENDLDWIVMKCLQKDRSRRYETANGLAADIEHHLTHEPVVARPPSTAYQVQKFVRRNKVMVTASAAVALTLVLGIVASTWLAFRAEAARRSERLEHYYSSVGLADAYIRSGNVAGALHLLTNCPPEYRNWEWGRCAYLCYQDLLTIQAHDRPIERVAINAANTRLATLDDNGNARVWNMERFWELDMPREVVALGDETNRVRAFAFSPDGQRLAMGDQNGVVTLWDAMSGRRLRVFHGHTNQVSALAFSPDGMRLATASADHTARIWAAETGEEFFCLGHAAGLIRLFFTPDGERLITLGIDGVKGWTTASGQQLFAAKVPMSRLGKVALDPTGRFFAVAEGGKVRLQELESGRERFSLTADDVRNLGFSPTGDRLAVARLGGSLRLWSTETGEEVLSLAALVHNAAFSPDGHYLAGASAKPDTRVWDARTGCELLHFKEHPFAVNFVDPDFPASTGVIQFSPDGRLLATGGADGIVKLWSAQPGRQWLPQGELVLSLAGSPDGARLAAGLRDGFVRVWDLDRGGEVLTLKGHLQAVYTVAFSPDGQWIASGSIDKTVRVWDARTGSPRFTLTNHTRAVVSVAFSPDSTRLVSGAYDSSARIWDVRTGECLRELLVEQLGVVSAVFTPDGQRLVTLYEEPGAGLKLWDANTGRELAVASRAATVLGHQSDLLFEVGGGRLAFAAGKALAWWDFVSEPVSSPIRAQHRIHGFTFSLDSERCFTASGAWTSELSFPSIAIRDMKTGQERLALPVAPTVRRQFCQAPLNIKTSGTNPSRVIASIGDDVVRVFEAFPWEAGAYPGPASMPLEERLRRYAASYWRQRLDLEQRAAPPSSVLQEPLPRSLWPPRAPETPPNLIDLTAHYNGLLTVPWESVLADSFSCNDLSELPSGQAIFDDVCFDVRGVIQLRLVSWFWGWDKFPQKAGNIPVRQKFKRLHVVHGTMLTEAEDLPIGGYVMHYADGTQQELEIRYGQDVRAFWWSAGLDPDVVSWWNLQTDSRKEATKATLAGELLPNRMHPEVPRRLYHRSWENPRPEVEVVSIDFVSRMTRSGPFLVALTVER